MPDFFYYLPNKSITMQFPTRLNAFRWPPIVIGRKQRYDGSTWSILKDLSTLLLWGFGIFADTCGMPIRLLSPFVHVDFLTHIVVRQEYRPWRCPYFSKMPQVGPANAILSVHAVARFGTLLDKPDLLHFEVRCFISACSQHLSPINPSRLTQIYPSCHAVNA